MRYLLFAAAFAAILLAACNGGGEEAQPSPTPSPAVERPSPSPEATPIGRPTTAPAAGKIAFVSDRPGGPGTFIMNPDGSGVTRLGSVGFHPAWSPDGRRIAFASSDLNIYVANADGSGQTQLTDTPGGLPDWSHDGKRIVFACSRDGTAEICVVNPDGSDQARLTDNADDDLAPVWSPDGSRIAFVSDRDGDCKVYVMNADGSDPAPVTDNVVLDCDLGFGSVQIAWSPADRIAFTTTGPNGDGEIYVANPDGSALTNLTNHRGLDIFPAWSPDSSRIAFASFRDGDGTTGEIYVMNADGSGQTRLTDNPASDSDPAWQPQP